MNDQCATPVSSETILRPEKEISTFYHKAANIGIGAFIFLFLISTFFGGIVGQLAKEGYKWPYYANGIVSSILFIFCTACGTIALLGIIKHGRKRLFWKGIICMIPVLGFLAAALLHR